MMNITTLSIIVALYGAGSLPQEAPEKLLDDAEAIMFSSCLQNKGRTIEECVCYVKTLKSELPKPDYNFFMEALYQSTNRDKDNFEKVMVKYGKTLEILENMSKHIAEIGAKIEVKCQGNGPIILPKPLKNRN